MLVNPLVTINTFSSILTKISEQTPIVQKLIQPFFVFCYNAPNKKLNANIYSVMSLTVLAA